MLNYQRVSSPALDLCQRHPHLLGTGMEMQSRELRVLRKAATFKQCFAKGIGSSGHGFSQIFPTGSRLEKGTKKAPKRGTMAGINPTRPNPKKNPSTPNWTNTDLIMCHGCQMMATDPNCKPTCFYLFNRKHKWSLNSSWQQAPQGLTTKMTTKQWHVQSFLYFYTKFCMAKRKLMRPPCEAPPRQSDWKHQNRYYLMP